jgi:hypothetical protein
MILIVELWGYSIVVGQGIQHYHDVAAAVPEEGCHLWVSCSTERRVLLMDTHDYPLFELSITVAIKPIVSETHIAGGGEIDSFLL